MAGVSVTITLNSARARAAVGRLQGALRNPAPMMRAIGTGLVENTHTRFERAVDPEGKAWKPLQPAYAAIKRGPGILRGSAMRGGLMGSITHRVGAGQVEVGSNKIYAGVDQSGAVIKAKKASHLVFRLAGGFVRVKSVTIPARPFVGFSGEDEDTTLDVVEGAVDRAIGGAR